MLHCVENSKNSELVIRRENDTRGCAKADATMDLVKGYSSLEKALHVIAENMTQINDESIRQCRVRFTLKTFQHTKSCSRNSPHGS
ncbi:hypothetical protein TNIN_328641 [Trichonephila inaurata madagascariensis]|uniref:Uncharacterized protein n=1 Tax=Trichonephila inaurata madagascariensis TaxID=2747483 RepID=A0A8X6YEM0_9ARAC|nr:hypothetical protein TNIN_375641 [Trichonephila inaurata madagascariensis]GFY69616.1 hypothetical protein TNIN_328641 [Trichonephila inaurata madagascariensis]